MYLAGANPDVRDALAAFLIATGPLAYFSGPYGWQIDQTWEDPLGMFLLVTETWITSFTPIDTIIIVNLFSVLV